MDVFSDGSPRRTSSHTSAASSRRSSTIRIPKPRKHASNASLQPPSATSETESLTSFPTLDRSPEGPSHDATIMGLPDPPRKSTSRKVTKATQSFVGNLVASTPSARSRAALFDDTPHDTRDIPGVLHLASDANIEHAMARSGPVALVRRLAEDLAQRDAQMTALQRKAEERERALKKLLKE
ncbi:hypothetical protein LTR39_006545, partial [Cryomyces antarcticus]